MTAVTPPAARRPGRDPLLVAGQMARLTATAVRRASTRPRNYGPELLVQLREILKIAWFPLALTSFALSFGPAGVQASGVLGLFGALDRLGGVYALLVVREFAPLVSGIVLAGVAGTSICADLGAREVRQENDALAVLGIDPIKALVVPRLLALLIAAVVFNVIALLTGVLGALAVVVQHGDELGPFFSSFLGAANTLELALSFVKCLLFGAVIAIVSCHQGLAVTGGAEGVGRAVNRAVVICFLAIGTIDYAFSQFVLATNPELSGVR